MIKSAFILLFIVSATNAISQSEKINGMNIVGERSIATESQLSEVQKKSASNWVALTPYSFCSVDDPKLRFDEEWQWKGERSDGIIAAINASQNLGLKIMIKPHIWVKEHGWAGDLNYNEHDWLIWEEAYRGYILNYAHIADSLSVNMLCIGTEVRKSASVRTQFWTRLIKDVRKIYSGQLIYAANWDNYHNISFWNDLDFIGVDAYFPLDSHKSVNYEVLCLKTDSVNTVLADFSEQFSKQIIFTEFGFRSVNFSAWRHWELPNSYQNPQLGFNSLNQILGFRSFFKTFWKEEYVAGGFVWKWHPSISGSLKTNDFTPQGKPALEVIKLWYEAF